jgi:AbiV family abortive infection protein
MSASSKPPFDPALLSKLARGAQLTFDNADALYREAKILGAAGAVGRALFLHQISLEECAKLELIGVWATGLLAGHSVDEKKVLSSFASHARKNRTNAYMLEGSVNEERAKARGDWKAALEEFRKLQAEFHAKSNNAKNASLYVDFDNGKFVAPVERITETMLAETAARNETFLGLMYPKLQMLLEWEKAPEQTQEHLVAFVNLMEAKKSEKPDDVIAAFRRLIDDFVEIKRSEVAKSKGN